ncbi:MAG: hypothetical protein LBC60_09185, partial [Spirochaetaceae bacterium]|nr:hypothetical protein [Spirochaetaceae bacterium]
LLSESPFVYRVTAFPALSRRRLTPQFGPGIVIVVIKIRETTPLTAGFTGREVEHHEDTLP